MVGKIGPGGDDSIFGMPPKIDKFSFKHDYSPKQQKAINAHIHDLKMLLQGNPQDPELQQQIADLRNQILSKDLPSIGLNGKNKPTIADTMQYIDQESGYSERLGMDLSKKTATSTRSKKSTWRQMAGGTPSKMAKQTRLAHGIEPVTVGTKTKLGGLPTDDDLNSISSKLQTWMDQHPNEVSANQDIFTEINKVISAFKLSPSQNSGSSLRAFIQSDTSFNSCTKELFNTNIYKTIPDLKSLFSALNFDLSLLPSQTKEISPPYKDGYTVYLLKNLPKTNTVTITSAPLGYIAIDPTTKVGIPTSQPTAITYDQFPKFNGQPYVYMPFGASGRITFGNPTIGAHPTFCEFTASSGGSSNSVLNFTGVDAIPAQSLCVQMTNDSGSSTRNGIQVDHDSFVSTITSLYNRYDPTGVWASTMKNPDGTIKSGKNMTDPRIKGALSQYLSNTFIPGISTSNPLYLADGHQGYFVRSSAPSGWSFTEPNGITMPVPALDDIGSWLSGSDAGWNPNPGGQPPMTDAQWAIAKALSGLINVGIPPNLINSKIQPVGNDYFSNFENVKNFYQAHFYNLYRRVVHESGCNAYASDFDDVLGGDGTLSGSPAQHTFFTISFAEGGSFSPSGDIDQIYNKSTDNPPGLNFHSIFLDHLQDQVTSLDNAIAQYNQDVEAFNKLSVIDRNASGAWQKLSAEQAQLTKSLSTFTGQVANLLQQYQPQIEQDLQTPLTSDEIQAMASDIVTRKEPSLGSIPTLETLPSQPSFGKDSLDAIWKYDYSHESVNYQEKIEDSASNIRVASSAYFEALNKYNDIPDSDLKDKQDFYNNTLVPAQKEVIRQRNLFLPNDNFNLLYYTPGILGKVIGFDPSKITQPQLNSYVTQIDNYINSDTDIVPAVPTLPSPPGPPGPPGPPPPPPPQDPIQQFKKGINDWLSVQPVEKNYQKPGDKEGYLRSTFADKIFAQIDSKAFKSIDQLNNWIAQQLQGTGQLSGLLSSQIYTLDPDFVAMGGKAAQTELQNFFNVLGIKAPVPTPPGPPGPPPPPPPPTNDAQYLLDNNANMRAMYKNTLIELNTDIKNQASKSDLKWLMQQHYNHYMDMLTAPGERLPPGVTNLQVLAKEMCQKEWSDAEQPPSTFPL